MSRANASSIQRHLDMTEWSDTSSDLSDTPPEPNTGECSIVTPTRIPSTVQRGTFTAGDSITMTLVRIDALRVRCTYKIIEINNGDRSVGVFVLCPGDRVQVRSFSNNTDTDQFRCIVRFNNRDHVIGESLKKGREFVESLFDWFRFT